MFWNNIFLVLILEHCSMGTSPIIGTYKEVNIMQQTFQLIQQNMSTDQSSMKRGKLISNLLYYSTTYVIYVARESHSLTYKVSGNHISVSTNIIYQHCPAWPLNPYQTLEWSQAYLQNQNFKFKNQEVVSNYLKNPLTSWSFYASVFESIFKLVLNLSFNMTSLK